MADVARFPDGNAASRVELNWIGFQALYGREMRRFLVVWVQTVLGPVIATLLFFAVFAVVLRTRTPEIGHLSYLEFIAPGLIMMAMLQNAFANTSSSILISKLSGTMADLLSAPLGPIELTAGYALAAVARAWIVGGATALVLLPLDALSAEDPGRLLLFACGGPLVFALLGMAGGIWAEKMEAYRIHVKRDRGASDRSLGHVLFTPTASRRAPTGRSGQSGVLPDRRLQGSVHR